MGQRGSDVSKDDPLESSRPPGRKATLWLEREGMEEARANFWQAYEQTLLGQTPADRRTWEISWAAAIAAFSYLMEGRIAPK